MENENEVVVPETTSEVTPEVTPEESGDESVEELKTKLAKAEEVATNQRIRAEKAEKLAKTIKVSETAKPISGDLSTKDLYALIDAKVPEDDIEEVREYAVLKKISIAEALKSNVIKTILGDKAEQRKTAAASNTTTSKRGSGAMTDEMLLAKAQKGDLPESAEDIAKLYKIRKGIK